MKRFAAHYIFLPDVGFIKQQVVETSQEHGVLNIFPLTEEVESVEWFPGVIALLQTADVQLITNAGIFSENISVFEKNIEELFKKHPNVCLQTSQCFLEVFDDHKKKGITLFPFLFYPFDFTSMQPVAGTRHKLLQ